MTAPSLVRPLPVPRGERRCIDCGRRCRILRCERCQDRDRRAEENKAKVAERKREWRQRPENKAKVAEWKREWYQRPENKAKVAEWYREWRQRTRQAPRPTCAGCGAALHYGGRGRPPVWCGGRLGCVAKRGAR